MSRDFQRIAIVNRGEPAMRLIHAVREYNAEHGTDLRTIALYTDPDRRSMFVRRADESYHLGPATFIDEHGNRQVTYLDRSRLADALLATHADAVWVGWGFVAEMPEFAALCERLGVWFIGPSAEVMRRLGDKIASKQIAEASDVPVAPWSGGAVASVDEAREHAARLGYPLLIKATAGGGGRGIRRVESDDELEGALASARAEARNAFGNEAVFLETLVPRAKHIEVQIIGDSAGTVWSVGVRDCSVQRRNQKLLEEAPSPSLTIEQDAFVRAAAARLAESAHYENAGTVEFLFEPETGRFSFMEVNARLQVEHPVTELTTGVDMVKLQLHVARGHALDPDPPPTVGHAIEARVNAEDPDAGFTPAPGRIEVLRLPTGPGLRVDTGVEEGDEIASEFDSMIAKVIAVGRNRSEALSRLRRGLDDCSIVITNGTSNKSYQRWLLEQPAVVEATADVGWIDRITAAGPRARSEHADVALVAGAIDAHREQMARERRQFRASALRGRPHVDTAVGRTVSLRAGGETYEFEVYRLAPNAYRVLIDGWSVIVRRHDLGGAEYRLEIRERSYRIVAASQGVTHLVEVDGHAHRITHDEGGTVRAPAPAVVVSIDVAPGDEVAPGDHLAVIEAMKMETVIEAEFAGVVEDVFVPANAQVGAGTALLSIRPTERVAATGDDRVTFDAISAPGQFAHGDCRHYLDAIRQALLGFDVDPALLSTMSNVGATPCTEVLDAEATAAEENDLIGIFADVIALFRRRPDDLDDELTRRTSEEYLFDYLRHPETRGRGLPDTFVDQLSATLRHFGVDDLEPTSELDVALFRIVLSEHRMAGQLGPVLRILEERLERTVIAQADDAFRRLLDRLVDESHQRYPAVHDLAEELRYRTFDEPMLTRLRDAVVAQATADIDALAAGPDRDRRTDLVASLVDCPQPLKGMTADRFVDASPALRGALVEVMVRRYYRIRNLADVRITNGSDRAYVVANYDHDGRRLTVIGVQVEGDRFASAMDDVAGLIARLDVEGSDVVVDVYIGRVDDAADPAPADLAAAFGASFGALGLRRVVVAPSRGVVHHTFRPDGAGGYREEDVAGGLHPMMAKRLELWRLDEFAVRRLPSTDDIYVFHGTANENRRDERVFVLAEVRDLTPVADDDGRARRLPEAERVFHAALGALRRFQSHRSATSRLQSNRIILYVWPPLDVELPDIAAVVQRLTPDTAGLGIQKVEVLARFPNDPPSAWRMLDASNPTGTAARLEVRDLPTEPIRPLQPYEQNVLRLRQRGLVYPYELVGMLTPDGVSSAGVPPGEFTEYDLADGRLVPVERASGENTANIVVGVVANRTDRYPEGMTRVVLLGDPSRGMGNLAEPECARINAALDLADELGVPVEWFAVSAGALIAMDSGTENMDWIAKVLRRIIEFTQAGGEVNVVVTGINVGAQPYWNAEATMLMHTRGILVMMPESTMVLTGKDALDFSGGVSADDNIGIGGYERIMGPNGQAQYFARDLTEALQVLFRHYEFTYVAPGERFARLATTSDRSDRDVRSDDHGGHFATIGEVFDEATNPGRKQPFEMRRIMAAVVDRDQPTMERWFGMADAEIPIVWDAFLGGRPVALLGFESKALPRSGFVPADGPDHWTAGTLFPEGSRKVARTINAASGNRPLVVLANLSGFDGSPESMRSRQLEFGAEIGRAVVNFDGPIVFCVVSRYHGGAFVVFSGALNDNFEVAAVEGAHASVIGGAPAAAVVFVREVRSRVAADPGVVELEAQVAAAEGPERARLVGALAARREGAHAEKLGEVADEFDARHDVQRAKRVGSIDVIIPAVELRPYLIDAVERGIRRVDGS